ncbi:MAG: EndoU domain-containing protein [Alphaproteobacteria bacterium]|nr:EndoU domain-containing protein [Alphaproteobacteria bacterium]
MGFFVARTFEIEIEGRTTTAPVIGWSAAKVPLADFAESWNRLVENAPADAGLAMVAQSQSAGGEDDDEEDEGKPTTGEGEEGAEDPPMDMGGENPLTPPGGQEPEQDPQNNRPSPPGAPRLTGRLPRRDPSDGIGPDDEDRDDPQNGDPTAADGTAKEPERQRQSREEAKPTAYLNGGFPIYDDETAPLPDPNDPKDPFWLRTDRDLLARIIRKTMNGQIVHIKIGAYREIRVYGGHFADGQSVRIVRTITTNNKGVRLAEIEIYDPQTRNWYSKPKKTTVFPTSWSRQRVMYEARKAFENATQAEGKLWRGRSPSGLTIEFVREPSGQIISFYPKL